MLEMLHPRSISKHSSMKEDGTYDVVVIGAGCIGSSVARELSKTTASVLLLESADDVTQGATKGVCVCCNDMKCELFSKFLLVYGWI